MKIEFKQWYKSAVTEHSDPFVLMPYMAFEGNKNDEVNYVQYGIHTFLPRFCTTEEFIKKIDVNSPLTDEQAKEIHTYVYQQVKQNKVFICQNQTYQTKMF